MRFDQHTALILRLRSDAPAMSDAQAAALQDEHLAYIADRVTRGDIVAAGPVTVGDDEMICGLSVWSAGPADVRTLCAQDPAVRAGRYECVVMTWLVPAGQIRFEPVDVPRSMADATADH